MEGERGGGSEAYRRDQRALIANKIAGEPTPATYDFKAAAIPQALLAAQPGAVNVASLGKIIPGWGQTEDFIAPWFATLEAKNK